MRLKRVKIFGFKTFADRTEFNVEGGLVAVVGPNGCGKSNLVDAILWGLGEANARHLRAANSQDVIFSGSSQRKALGYAEVNLLFDNSDGSLPVPTSEVSVTRRLTRAGESEYLINRQPCRQRDIYELLADSGLGRSGYAIVGQKEIDQALSASPEERRAWVDEAAGVVRYRTRKQDAERRLTAARTHLERVEDVLRELEVQREPLRAEAEEARIYRSVLESLRSVERGMLIREVATGFREVEALRVSIEKSASLMRAENGRAEKLDSAVRAIGETVSELEREMDAVRNLQQSSLTGVERAQAEVRLAEERLRGLDQLESTLREESGSLASQLVEASRDLETARSEERVELDALAALTDGALAADSELRRLTGTLTAVEAELNEAKRQHQIGLRQEAEAAHRRERIGLAKREVLGIESALTALESQAAEAERELVSRETEHLAARQALREAEEGAQKALEAEVAEGAELRKLLAEQATLEGRHRGIEATIEAHDGMPQGPRAVLEAAANGRLQGRYRPVGQAISVPKELALAFETALGSSTNDLIVDFEADAKAAIALLKEKRLGRATFQPIPLMRPRRTSSDEGARLRREKGVLGFASDLATCEAQERPVIDSLLGRVLIVEHLDVALRLVKSSGWKRMVTLEGEVVHSSGAVTGGVQAKGHYGLVQRKADLADVGKSLVDLDRRVTGLRERAARRAEEAEGRKVGHVSLREAVRASGDEMAEAGELARALRREHDEALRSHSKLSREIAALEEPLPAGVTPVRLAPLEAARDRAVEALSRHSGQTEQTASLVSAAQAHVRQASARRGQAERRHGAAGEADEKRQKRLHGLGPEREVIRSQMNTQAKAKAASEEAARLAGERLSHLQEERGAQLEKSLDLAEEASSARKNAVTIADSMHQAELNRARADSRRANALQRLVEDYSLDEEDALAQSDSIELPSDASQVVNRLRRELKAMGDVNVGAIEAFERLSERWDDLTAQREDVVGGIEQVQESISTLDKLTRDRFLETFRQLETTFSEYFVKLFGGGEGRVRLTQSDSLLDSGVEMEVTLPGKKRQALALLSGGERSLCGAAFLFGLLKIKPSPLVVLDEVDAPLDGRNVERFADLLREFTDRIQFIVITHNHATIVRADVFLGVSMQEPGVSILVPVKLPAQSSNGLAVVGG